MMKQQQLKNHRIDAIFPFPIYVAKRDSELSIEEEREIEDITKKGDGRAIWNMYTHNHHDTYIFDTKLANLKEFCEQHIKIYVEEIISPEEALDYYITQSWLNITKPGEYHYRHTHTNSIISGVFYIATEEDDNIQFHNSKKDNVGHQGWELDIKKNNLWNSSIYNFNVEKNNLLLFPAWLEHGVEKNEKATRDRISLAFNVFAKGTFGRRNQLNELILK